MLFTLLNIFTLASSTNVMDFCISDRILEVYKQKILYDIGGRMLNRPLFPQKDYSYFDGAFKIKFSVIEPVVTRVSVNTDVSGVYLKSPNLIVLNLTNLAGYIKFNWKYSSKVTKDSGEGYMDIYDSTFSAVVEMHTLSNGTLKLNPKKTSYLIKKFDTQIYGGQEASAMVLILNYFSGFIEQSLQEVAVSIFTDVLIVNINEQISELSLMAPISKNYAFYYGLNGDPVADTSSLQLNMMGVFVNMKKPDLTPNVIGQVNVPNYKSTSLPIQIYTSAYTLNTLTNVMFQEGAFMRIIDSQTTNLTITTSTLNYILPGIETTFTPNQPCIITCNANTYPSSVIHAPSFTFTSGYVTSTFLAQCNVTVSSINQLAISLQVNVEANTTLQLANWELSGNIALLNVQDIEVIKNNIQGGTVNTQGMEDFLNLLANLTLPFFNQRVINPGFPLPPVPGVNLQDSELVLNDEYFSILSDPSFST